MRVIAASILAFEALIVVLAVPVAVTLGDVDPMAAVLAGLALVVLCLAAAGSLGRPWGYRLGWLVQALLLASGFVVHAMFLVGGLFAILWVVGLRVGRRGEQLRAQRWGEPDDPQAVTPDAAG